ncbi:MAG: TetR family transcriptional regulator [candidate division Zixibacteria bacterium]|nr:TetR family transcriptional regulator [candidate division Zixibacteria bacterium]
MSPRIVDKDKKRNEIALAAMRVFARKGARNTRMVDIAAEAEIGKGTIYEYFRNREEILGAAFSLVMAEMERKLGSALRELQSPEEKIKIMIRLSYETLSRFTADFLEIFVDFWSAGIRQREQNSNQTIDLKTIYETFRRQLASILKEGIEAGRFRRMDTTAVASAIMAIVDGLLLQLILDRRAFDDAVVVDQVVSMVLKGIETEIHNAGDMK